jgi:hypothetical protein
MKTCSISEARNRLGKLADRALAGKPTLVQRSGKLVIIQAYPSLDPIPQRPPGYFADCYTDKEAVALENRCGGASD